MQVDLVLIRERLGRVEGRLDRNEPRLEALDRAAEIAVEVRRLVRAERAVTFTRWQKLGGGLVGLVAVADFAVSLWRL